MCYWKEDFENPTFTLFMPSCCYLVVLYICKAQILSLFRLLNHNGLSISSCFFHNVHRAFLILYGAWFNVFL